MKMKFGVLFWDTVPQMVEFSLLDSIMVLFSPNLFLGLIQSKSQNFVPTSPRRNSERKGLKIAWLLSRLFQELLDHLLLCCKFPNKGSTVSATFYLIISGKAVISEAPHKVVPKSSGGDYDGVGGF